MSYFATDQSFCYSHQIDITLNLEVFFFFFFYLKFELPANSMSFFRAKFRCLEFSYANMKHVH